MFNALARYLFPPKCILCKKLLNFGEMDLCTHCREHAPAFSKENFRFSFVARWTAIWYYKDAVRASLLRYKFYHRRSYVPAYTRLLAQKLIDTGMDRPDFLVYVPISRRRKWKRGYDQVALIAEALSKELDLPLLRALQKIRHTPPQSGLKSAPERRANVLGAYRVICPQKIAGKHLLLLDDIVTTGATASECARMLTLAGAAEVSFAALAAAPHDKKQPK